VNLETATKMLGFAIQSFIRTFAEQPVNVRRERLQQTLTTANPTFIAAIREALPPETSKAFDRFVTVAKDWK
jgi:hypothetical protein